MVNKAIIVGRVGKDPEVRTTTNSRVASFSLATTEKYNDQEKTQWHNCIVWAKLADVVEKYVKKGQLLYVEGRIEYRSYDDKDGNKRYITDIVVSSLQMLGGKKTDDVTAKPEPQAEAPSQSNTSDEPNGLPF